MSLERAPLPASPVPPRLTDGAATLTEALATLVEQFPEFPCLTLLDRRGREQSITLDALWTRARIVQTALVGHGLRPGGFALLVMPTGAELLAAYVGVMLAGGIPGLVATPSNRLADRSIYARRIGSILRDAEAQVLVCDDELVDLFASADREVLGATRLLTPSGIPPSAVLAPIHPARGETFVTVQYSSGSTGAPKGVLLTHRAVLNNVRAMRDGFGVTPADVSVNWIPLYHDMGLVGAFLLPLLSGCPSVLIPTMDFMRDPALWLWAVHRYRGTLSWAPNFAYAICASRVADAELGGLDLSSWRVALNGAEPVLAPTIVAFAARFARHGFAPQAMTPVWGLAENVAAATVHPIGAAPRVETLDRQALALRGVAEPTSAAGFATVAVGRCLPHCAVEIRADDGRVLPARAVGAVWLQSNSLFEGYHRDAAATALVLVDGWLNTGDRGYLADGDLFFIARDKDLVVIGGEKYAPHDLETVINQVEGVREGCAVVFGVLSEARGTEDIAAVAETKLTDAAALDDLRQRIRAALGAATGLGLRYVLLVPPGGIEKTTSGKLARRATRARYADAFAE